MARKRFRAEQIVSKLREADVLLGQRLTVAVVCKRLEITDKTYHRWRRECLAIDVARKLNHDDVLERLSWLMATRGVPEYIRSDNGSEFAAHAVRDWLKRLEVKTLYITPGSPWENGYIESFNSKLADELLAREILCSLHEAKVLIERSRIEYNRSVRTAA